MGFITRIGKGLKLTWQELDDNFTKIVGSFVQNGKNLLSPEIPGPGTISLIGNDAVINGIGTMFINDGFTEFYVQEGEEVICLIIEQEFTASNTLAYISQQYNMTTDPARINPLGPQWNYGDVTNRPYFYAKNVIDNGYFNIINGFGNAVTTNGGSKVFNIVLGFFNGLADSFDGVIVGTKNHFFGPKNIVFGVENKGKEGSGNSVIVGRQNNNQGGDNVIVGENNRSFLSSMHNFMFSKNTEMYASFSSAIATENVVHRGGGTAAFACSDVTIPENWTNCSVIGFKQGNVINDLITYDQYVVIPKIALQGTSVYADDTAAGAAGIPSGGIYLDTNLKLTMKL